MRFESYLLLGILSFSILSCSTKAPPVTWCSIDAPRNQLLCVGPDGKESRLTLPQADKYTCLSQEDDSKIANYVLELERIAARCK